MTTSTTRLILVCVGVLAGVAWSLPLCPRTLRR